ncbi:MAG: arsinothricin resistance N-acetyltransferase ArsN1 family B [Acidobacteriota bacterium]
MTPSVRPARPADGDALARLYNHYVRETVVTFEEEPVSAAMLVERVRRIQALPLPWLVAEAAGELLGYAYASPWRVRRAYRFAVEVTVYAAPDQGGRGIGSRLYACLLEDLQGLGIHTALGGIALPNPASVALHEKFGFVQVAHLREVGYKHGRWIDVGYWQRTWTDDSNEETTP